ncbi:MAG: protein YgfX [Methylophilaceae bacterium]
MKPINLTLQVSFRLLILLIVAAISFGSLCFFLPISWFLCVVILCFVGGTAVYCSLRYALLWLPSSVVAISISNKNQLHFLRKNGEQLVVQVLENTVVTHYLTVLNGQMMDATALQRLIAHHVIILPDAVNSEDYRQLRVWLRWQKHARVI